MVEFLVPSSLKVCVVCQVDSITHKTKVICDRHDPSFTESFSFVIEDPTYARINIRVVDKADVFTDRTMGEVELSVNNFVVSSIEDEYLLEGKYEECYVGLKATWYVIDTAAVRKG